jgi:paired small multidrug resistance pump
MINFAYNISIADSVGLVGVFITLVAYFLLNIRKLKSQSFTYTGLNALGSMLIIYSLIYDWSLAAFVMECCWFLMSCYGMLKR